MSSAPAYSCVVDNSPLFRWQCHIFITTLIHNCGVSPADIHIHAIDPEPFFLEHLGNLGVHVVRAARWGDGKYCNKLTQFDTPALRNAGHVILCDCDLAFAAPPTGPAVPGWISGKPVDLPNPDLETLEAIFEASGVPFPETVDTYRGKTFATNCNGGLYGIPGEHFDRLGERWRAHAARLLGDEKILERLGERRIHVDQIAFSLAVSELALPFAPLSTADNCPTHLTNLVPQVADALVGQAPRALHFHDRLDPCGFLLPPGNPLIDDAVGRVNAALAAHFSNRLFWDYRYARHSALGSGIGSRAEMKRKKRLMLKLAGFESAASVLDVGCGDGEVVKGLASGAYTGIDMSAEALDLHRDNNPAASLLLSADRDKAPSAELVLCLDVLIHQDTPEGYRDLIDFVAGKAVRRLIISGYDRREDLDASAMCNFFEGLPESLERTKLFSRIFRIARYRNLSVYVAEKDAGHGGTGTDNDMADEMVGRLLAGHTAKDAFLACLLASRSVFGWHTRQYSRAFEYPWLLRQFGEELDGLRVAEFGAGISPLPLLLSMRGAAVTTLDHGAKVPFAEVRGRNEWGYLDYAAIDDAILSINGPLTGDNVPEGGFDAWYSISVIEHMPRNDRLVTLRHMHDSLRPGGRLFLTLDLYKNRTDLWNYCSGEVVEDIERHGDLSAFIQELETMGFTDVEHLIHRMPPSERIDIAYVSATRPAAEEETETEPAETNLDIGGQNNRDDQEGKWTIVDLHDGADIKMNLENESLPLPDSSVDNIYSSHCLEHLEPDRLRPVFADLFRVLRDGGRIRLAVPSFNKGVFYYYFRPGVLKRRMMPRLNSNTPDTKMSRLSSWFYTETSKLNGTPGHKTAWDFELMRTYLEEAGFSHVRKSDLDSCSPVFSGKDNPEYRPFSLYVEARKDLQPERVRGILPTLARRIEEYGEARLIRRSCALDTVWYAHTYPDVRASGLSPILHYLRRGWRQGYDPSGLFDTRAYLNQFPGLAVNGVCPLVHHLRNTTPNMFRLNAIVPPQVKNLIAPLDFRSAYDLGNKKTNNMPYAAYYRAMGVDYSSIDLNGLDGAIAVDLAEPVDLPPKQAVMNIGTSEHVVDQEAVFRNIHNLAADRMIHWVPLTNHHPQHGVWGYDTGFFEALAALNHYTVEKNYLEITFGKWKLVCCSLRKKSGGRKFHWSEDLASRLTYNEHGSCGVDYR